MGLGTGQEGRVRVCGSAWTYLPEQCHLRGEGSELRLWPALFTSPGVSLRGLRSGLLSYLDSYLCTQYTGISEPSRNRSPPITHALCREGTG